MIEGSLEQKQKQKQNRGRCRSRRVVEVKKSGRKMVESRKKVENVTILGGGVNE